MEPSLTYKGQKNIMDFTSIHTYDRSTNTALSDSPVHV